MLFTRTHEFQLPITKDEFKNRLLGKHVKIHNLDFEVIEDEYGLNIIPHAEQETDIKTLPITELDFREEGGRTKVVMKSSIRSLDAGGPQLIVIFCTFLFLASVILFFTTKEMLVTTIIFGLCLLIFSVFWFRMQTGYFDYVRKIKNYVKTTIA